MTVRSEGAEVLRVTGLRFTGRAAKRLRSEGTCEGASLSQGEMCSITVRVKPGAAGRAQLRIQQNLPGPASLVDIQVDGSARASDPDLLLDTALKCSVRPANERSEQHRLTIVVTVESAGPDPLTPQVPVRVSSNTGLLGEEVADVTIGSATPINVDLDPLAYGQARRFTVTVDPNGDIAEQDETNNTLDAIVFLPEQPTEEQTVKCAAR